EEPNLRPLHAKLDEALKALGRSAEIIYVDDGSTDGSLRILREIAQMDSRVRVVALRRNYGQTAAMAAGIDAASGRVQIPMDADLRFVGGCPRDGDSGRTSRAHDGQVEIRFVANAESRLRLDDDQVHGLLSNETDLRVWFIRYAGVCHFTFSRPVRALFESHS